MKLPNKLVLVLIFILALVPRLVFLFLFPHHPNWDEVSLGYNSYSILKTGRDEWGNTFPAIFRAYGDYKLPLYIYLTLPFIAIFGLNPISIRLLSIIAGSLLPIAFYLITRHLFPKYRSLSIASAAIGILATWSIFLSGIALEANLSLAFFFFSLYFLLKQNLGLSSLLFALNLFTYNSSRALLPFYILSLLFVWARTKKTPPLWFHFLPLILAISIFIYQTLGQSGQARFSWVTLIDSGAVNQINNLRSPPLLGIPLLSRLVFNKAIFFIYLASKNYLSHFNPNFLFINGGTHYQFSIPNFYLLHPLLFPFFVTGLFFLIKNIRSWKFALILFFLIITPIPSAITRDAPHVLRSLNFVALSTLITVFGIGYLTSRLKRVVLPLYILIAVLSFAVFSNAYNHYLRSYSQSWQEGYQSTIDFIRQHYSDYNLVYFSKKYGEPHEFVLFFWPWNPQDYQTSSTKNWDYHANWYWVNSFDKFIFFNDWEVNQITPKPRSLLVTSPGNYPKNNAKLLKTVNFKDGTPAFDIVSYD